MVNGEAIESEAIDFLLLDPPRAGAENNVIKGILARNPRQISYVSCDPATLARDLKKLLAAGYFLDSVAAFDMFPQTHHVETVVRSRQDSRFLDSRFFRFLIFDMGSWIRVDFQIP